MVRVANVKDHRLIREGLIREVSLQLFIPMVGNMFVVTKFHAGEHLPMVRLVFWHHLHLAPAWVSGTCKAQN